MDNSSVGSISGGGFDSGGAMQNGYIQMETSFENMPEVSEVEAPEEVKTENSSIAQVQIDDAKEIMDIPGTAHEKLAGLSEMNDEDMGDDNQVADVSNQVVNDFLNDDNRGLEVQQAEKESVNSFEQQMILLQSEALQAINENINTGNVDREEVEKLINELKKLVDEPKGRVVEKDDEPNKMELILLLILRILEKLFALGEVGVKQLENEARSN